MSTELQRDLTSSTIDGIEASLYALSGGETRPPTLAQLDAVQCALDGLRAQVVDASYVLEPIQSEATIETALNTITGSGDHSHFLPWGVVEVR